jgi:DNA-binding transcriptional ArsR family regulator
MPGQSPADLVIHPVRLRIIMAIAGQRLTARQLLAALGGVPQATLYYHLGLLTEAGFLQVVEERPVRGTVEKVYAVGQSPVLSPADLEQATPQDHLRYFTMFASALIGEFARYLEHPPHGQVDLLADGVGYRQVPLYLSDVEFVQMVQALNEVLQPFLAYQPEPGRTRRIFTRVLMPDAASSEPLESADASISDPAAEHTPLASEGK